MLSQRFQAPQQTSPPGDRSKGLGIPRESNFAGQQDLTIELPQDWENRDSWRTQTKPFEQQDAGERSRASTKTEPDLSASVLGISREVMG